MPPELLVIATAARASSAVNTGSGIGGTGATPGCAAAVTTRSTSGPSASEPATSTGSPASASCAAAAPNRSAGYRREGQDAPGASTANGVGGASTDAASA